MREGERQKMRSETLQRGPATAGQGSQWTGASGELGFEASPDWTHFSDESLWLLLWEWTKAGEEAKTGAEETEEATAVIQVRDESSLRHAGRTGERQIVRPRWRSHKVLAYQCKRRGDLGSISESGWSPGGGNATHSSILAWRIPWTEKPNRTNNPRGPKESDMTEHIFWSQNL